jgi:hypothetical protein
MRLLQGIKVVKSKGPLQGLMHDGQGQSYSTPRELTVFKTEASYGSSAYVATAHRQFSSEKGTILGPRVFMARETGGFHELRAPIWGQRFNSQGNSYGGLGMLRPVEIRNGQYGKDGKPVMHLMPSPNSDDHKQVVLEKLAEGQARLILESRQFTLDDAGVTQMVVQAVLSGAQALHLPGKASRYFVFTDDKGKKRALALNFDVANDRAGVRKNPRIFTKNLDEDHLWEPTTNLLFERSFVMERNRAAGWSDPPEGHKKFTYKVQLSDSAAILFDPQDNSFYFESENPEESLSLVD